MYSSAHTGKPGWKPLSITAALLFLYSTVLAKLAYDWWTDDNYSHGLLVPFVIGYIVWHRLGPLKKLADRPQVWLGVLLTCTAALMLLSGTLASVLFAQRLSLVMMLAGVVVYYFGVPVLKKLTVPFALLLLAIPIPQLIFNKIAFPLQILASKAADRGIGFLGIPVERMGNIIEIPYRETGQVVSLEVVEACSGIRSLMTLITLALILGYFTRQNIDKGPGELGWVSDGDKLRTALLMIAAIPVALMTNAARVMFTGVLAHYYGQTLVEGAWHDISGSLVFIAALLLLFATNLFLRKVIPRGDSRARGTSLEPVLPATRTSSRASKTIVLLASILICGIFVNWFQYRGEASVARRPLNEIPDRLGTWEQRNEDIRFDAETESVLKATDYVMRDYYGPGKRLNLYIGYYASQRTGATYHSPLSCLPGTGWEMTEPELVEITTHGGRRFTVNRYIIRHGDHSEFLIYWYQGRGRIFASEYEDKLYTSLDSITRRRSDGGMVRIMTPIGKDASRSMAAAIDLTGQVADNIGEFLPD